MDITVWFQNNYIEIFGAVTGIIYVLLEIRQNIWLWPVGIVTSAVYILVFFTSKFYADMSLQVYYLAISVLGWYWWMRGRRSEGEKRRKGEEEIRSRRRRSSATAEEGGRMRVTRLTFRVGLAVAFVFILLYVIMFFVLSGLTDSPVPEWDSFITSLSIVATWMLARKIYEHWYLWVVVNSVSAVIFFVRGLYPTVILYIIYGIMSFAGMVEWKKSIYSSSEELIPED